MWNIYQHLIYGEIFCTLSCYHSAVAGILLVYCVIKGQSQQDHTCYILSNGLCCKSDAAAKVEKISTGWNLTISSGLAGYRYESSLRAFFCKDSSYPSVCLFPPSQLLPPHPPHPRPTPLHINPATFPAHPSPIFHRPQKEFARKRNPRFDSAKSSPAESQ